MKHRRRKGGRHRRRLAPSVAVVTQQVIVDLTAAATNLQTTVLQTQDFGVSTPGSETVNRKVVRVTGDLVFTAALPAGKAALCMFALWAHPDIEDFPTVSDFDPWAKDDQPGESGFEGRMKPRPYGRRIFTIASPASGTAETIIMSHRYHTKAERLLRPGWKLSMGLWVRGDASTTPRLFGGLRATVAG